MLTKFFSTLIMLRLYNCFRLGDSKCNIKVGLPDLNLQFINKYTFKCSNLSSRKGTWDTAGFSLLHL
jgi:hypothetical protein